MITEQQKNDLLALLRSHTLTTFRTNQKQKLPIVISSKGTFFKRFWWERLVTINDSGEINRDKILTEFIEEISKSPHQDDIIAYLEHAIREDWYDKRYGIIPVDYFHYDDRWFMYKYSADEPEYTFGILKVDNMPYNSFEGKRNNKSFVCSMHDLLYNEYCEPFMLFIDRKFVNWNYIDIVFDCDDTYLLLHGEQYNRYNLKDAEIHMVILPFKVSFIGSEADWHFNMMYNITKDYIQNSLTDYNDSLKITVPSVDESYVYRGMVYNIGAWLYTQLKYYKLNLLSQDRISKLSKFDIVKDYKDSAGNIINTLITKFNALDKDSYDKALYDKISFGTKDIYEIESIFKFDDDGLLDDRNGNNIIALFDNNLIKYGFYNPDTLYPLNTVQDTDQIPYYEKLTMPAKTKLDTRYTDNVNIVSDHDTRVETYSYDTMPFIHRSNINKGVLFRENYLFFRYGLFYPEYGETYGYNIKYLAGNTIKVSGPQWYTMNAECNVYSENDYKNTMDSYNGICETIGSVPNKTVKVKDSYYLKLDTIIFVKFLEDNRTSGNDIITIDINGTGPMPIYYMNAPIRYDYITAYCTLTLKYDGNVYNVIAKNYGDIPYEPIGSLAEGQSAIIEKINNEWGKILKINGNSNTLIGGYVKAHTNPNDGSYIWPFKPSTQYINDSIVVKEFYHNPIEKVKNHIDHFHSQQDVASLSYNSFNNQGDNNDSWKTILQQLLNCLDYSYYDKFFYKENCDIGNDTVIKYDPTLFNVLYHTNASSESINSYEANDYRNIHEPYQYENGVGLKIPRYRYKDNESYVIVFENGELIQEYSQMIVYPNFFFIPVTRDIGELELLWFKDINNNEVHFHINREIANTFTYGDNNEWVQANISQHIINPGDIKVFDKYPEKIIKYKKLIKESDDIAFNISMKDENNILYLMKDAISEYTDMENKEYTAVSSRKFIYQRLYVDQKVYRIKIDKRFRYCDNQHQYMLFINGRRMRDDSFLITIPKYSRPFWDMYLYTSRYVDPSDRVELFYVPCPLIDLNINDKYKLNESGYLRLDKSDLEVPLDPRLYMFFINGKKINKDCIIPIDSHTIKIGSDVYSLYNLVINPIYKETIPEVTNYLKNSQQYSSYDNIISSIANFANAHPDYYKLNYLFNNYISLSDTEPNMITTNVGRIAILNEIIRDFWVTSGYEYNEVPFIYDYLTDEYINNIDNNGNVIIPALDASKIINIDKNDVFIVAYTPEYVYNEIGSSNVPMPKISWGYSNKNILLDDETLSEPNIVKQRIEYSINGEDLTVDIDPDNREWQYNNALTNGISADIEFKFTGSTGFNDMHRTTKVRFVNGIYYGNIDEDSLQHYANDVRYEWYDRIFALAPKNYVIPAYEDQKAESIEYTMLIHKEYNRVIKRLGYHIIDSDNEQLTPFARIPSIDEMETEEVIDNQNYVLDKDHNTNMRNILIYRKPTHLQHMISSMNYNLQISPEIVLDNYIIGNNNYFVYACPRRLAFDNDGTRLIEFIMPDPKSNDIISHCRDDYATPIYTSGNFNNANLLENLNSMKMVYMGEIKYTNHSGYTEWYCIWRSNGFFTRLFDEYGIHINIRYKDKMSSYNDGLGHEILPDDYVGYVDQGVRFTRNTTGFSINNLQIGSDRTANIIDSVITPTIDSSNDPANNVIFIDDLRF